MTGNKKGRPKSSRWLPSIWLVALAASLPLVIFAGLMTAAFVYHLLANAENLLATEARTLLASFDTALIEEEKSLETLASAPALAEGRFADFEDFARRLAAQNGWQRVMVSFVASPHEPLDIGRGRRPETDPLSAHAIATVAHTHKAYVSDVAAVPGSGTGFITIAVAPPGHDYVVSAEVPVARLAAIMTNQRLPADHVAWVFDRQSAIAVQSTDDRPVGHKVSQTIRSHAADRKPSLFYERTIDGTDYLSVVMASAVSGYRVAYGSTRDAFVWPLTRVLTIVDAGALAAALTSALGALWLTRRIRRKVLAEEAHRIQALEGAVEEARISKARMLAAIKARAVTIIHMDLEFRITSVINSQFETEGGYVKTTLHDHLDKACADSAHKCLGQVLRHRRPMRHEFEVKFKYLPGGHHYDVVGQPILNDQGEPTGILIAATCIDQEVKTREEMKAARLLAERANHAKSRFLAAASHDLRQPMQAMRLLHQVLEQRVADKPTSQVVDAMGAAVDSACELLNALLDVSTLEAGMVQPKPSEFCVADVIEAVCGEYQDKATEHGIRLRHFVPVRYHLRTDRDLLKRVVHNLVDNAFRYTEHGGILVGCRRSSDRLLIQAWDTGRGIASDKLDEIFEEFYQVGNPARDRNLGLGLGLAIARRVAGLMGMEVWVSSREGRGSVFTISIPMALATEPDGVAPDSALATVPPPPPMKPPLRLRRHVG